MPDTRPVELVLDLPAELAEDLEQVWEQDPEYLGKALRYAIARRVVFDELRRSLHETTPLPPPLSEQASMSN